MFVDRILELNEIFRRNREKAQALSNPVVKARIAAVAAEEEAERENYTSTYCKSQTVTRIWI